MPALRQTFFSKNSELECKEIGDGNLNLVFRVKEKLQVEKALSLNNPCPMLG